MLLREWGGKMEKQFIYVVLFEDRTNKKVLRLVIGSYLELETARKKAKQIFDEITTDEDLWQYMAYKCKEHSFYECKEQSDYYLIKDRIVSDYTTIQVVKTPLYK